MKLTRKAALAATASAMLLTGVATATPAVALNGDYNSAAGVKIRSGTSTSTPALGVGYPGQGAAIACFTTGQNINGNPKWDRNTNLTTGVSGYSADYYMTWTGTLYQC